MPSPSEPGQTYNDVKIPLADGVELAAEVRLPDQSGPSPTIVSYIPYHKDDFLSATFEYFAHSHFLEHGYSTMIVDLRGLGASTGDSLDAFDAQEGPDGAAIVEWTAAQDWSDGNIGMWGHSYGAIVSLKTAAESPRHLKAIIPMGSCLSLYDDWLFPGGCRNMLGGYGVWGGFMAALQFLPPMDLDPQGTWWKRWKDRVERADPWVLPWEEHPDRTEYWSERAVDPGKIETPTFLIGGWRDVIAKGTTEAFEGLAGPRKMLMGPWGHITPEQSLFEPVDHLAEMVRWWDRWLRDSPDSAPDEQPVRFYSQNDGRWLETSSWPPAGVTESTLWLGGERKLQESEPASVEEFAHTVDPTVGTAAGLWEGQGDDLGYPIDQGADDLRSLAFTGAPLEQPVRIAGTPVAKLHVSVEDGEDLHLVAKLCDVAEDGRSSLISTGLLNAHHRVSTAAPEPIELGIRKEYTIQLAPIAYVLAPGHRLRLSITGADFPRIWPTRTNPTFRLATGPDASSRIVFPVLPEGKASEFVPDRPPVGREVAPRIIEAEPRWRIERDEINGEAAVISGGRMVFDTPGGTTRLAFDHVCRAGVRAARPDGARVSSEATITAKSRLGVDIAVWASINSTSGGTSVQGRVSIDGTVAFERGWLAERKLQG
jgi:putative CocE/NonD family hydrolase